MIHSVLAPQAQILPISDAELNWRKPLPDHRFGSYADLLKKFIDHEYESCFFQDVNQPKKQLVLRHDIDFDTHFALQAANTESRLGLKGTYFFLLRSNFYNVLAPADYENISQIREMGHHISIHFDPSIYEDFHKGLQREVQIFRDVFNQDVEIISLHRPNRFFQEFDAPIFGIEHTYQTKYFRDIKYISDSTGVWRYGHPCDTPEFAQQKTIHLLTHPIWWMLDGQSNLDKLTQYYKHRVQHLKSEFSNNCIPFRNINDSL